MITSTKHHGTAPKPSAEDAHHNTPRETSTRHNGTAGGRPPASPAQNTNPGSSKRTPRRRTELGLFCAKGVADLGGDGLPHNLEGLDALAQPQRHVVAGVRVRVVGDALGLA